jgi:hypothetical protein
VLVTAAPACAHTSAASLAQYRRCDRATTFPATAGLNERERMADALTQVYVRAWTRLAAPIWETSLLGIDSVARVLVPATSVTQAETGVRG